jgi:membrane protein YdbS with pleckstrin-like domain
MTLITCSECGKPVSTLAAACPNCGAPPRLGGGPASPPASPPASSPAIVAVALADDDRVLWTSSPSQAENAGRYLVCAVLALIGAAIPVTVRLDGVSETYALALAGLLMVIALIVWFIGYLRVKRFSYTISTRRLTIRQGLLTTRIDDIALYRIKDIELRQSFWERLGGIGSILVISADAVDPVAVLGGVKDPEAVRRLLRGQVDVCRRSEGVRTYTT